MNRHFVLLDFENVQPADLSPLDAPEFEVIFFLGVTQTKLSIEYSFKLQRLHATVDYVQSPLPGRNALDFHITYYLGRLAVTHPEASFYIISQDAGYDPLICHLESKGISCQRLPDLGALTRTGDKPARPSIPVAKPAKVPAKAKNLDVLAQCPQLNQDSAERQSPRKVICTPVKSSRDSITEPAQRVIADLAQRGGAKPKTTSALRSTIASILKVQPSEPYVDRILRELEQCDQLKISNGKVTYPVMS